MKLKQSMSALFALALSGLVTGALASASQGPLDGDHASADAGDLERGLAAIDVANIRSDLHFIASDEMKGRDTPSPEQRKAARFIRARLERLGLRPAGTNGSYFHDYQMVRSKLDRDAMRATLAWADSERELTFGEDYYVGMSGVANLETAGKVVFVGGGSAQEVDGLDLNGRWAFAYEGDVSPGARLENVRARGAIGLVLASPLGVEDKHGPDRARGYANFLAGREQLRVITKREAFPTVYLGAEVAEDLCRAVVGELKPGKDLKVELEDLRVVADASEPMDLENVAGLFEGKHPDLKHEVIILSAHYDHVGAHDGEIFNGADDNGSGTVGLMALAEALVANGPLDRSILLLWVSGEEKGLKGSEAWTLEPTLPAGMRAVCDLNIDMIGRNAPDYLLITPTAQHEAYNGLTRMAEKFAPLEGFPKLGSCDEYWMRSDHMNFSVNMGIPVAFLFSDVHADYHKPTDTVEKIDYDKIQRVCRLVFRMIDALSSMDLAEL